MADIVIVPTVVPEAHPAVVDDALKYKKHIIAFRVNALEEMIGDRGIFCEEITSKSLYNKIMKAINDINRK